MLTFCTVNKKQYNIVEYSIINKQHSFNNKIFGFLREKQKNSPIKES